MDHFKHRPIDLEGPSFRLLGLFKYNTSGIHGELFDAWLDGGIPYEALSYTWGSSEKFSHIILNGCRMDITKNLWVILNDLESWETDRILWIDAICIDQGNHKERGHQIDQMGKIYRQAEEVIIWLGHSTVETNIAMEFMQSLHVQHDSAAIDKPIWGLDQDSGVIRGFSELFKRPWFRRIWILQEVANARKATIACGRKSAPAGTLKMAAQGLFVSIPRHVQVVLDIMPGSSRNQSWFGQQQNLQTLLEKFAESEATQSYDRIFALLGISSDAKSSKLIRPDYSKTERQIVQDTVCFLLGAPALSPSSYDFLPWTIDDLISNVTDLDRKVLLEAWYCQEPVAKELMRESQRRELEANISDESLVAYWCIQNVENNGGVDMLKALIACGKLTLKMIHFCSAWMARMANPWLFGELIWSLWLRPQPEGPNEKLMWSRRPQLTEDTPYISWAAGYGYRDLTESLLGDGNKHVNAEDKEGMTPLSHAARNGCEDVVKLLLETHETKVDWRDRVGRTPLSYACQIGEKGPSIVQSLLMHDEVEVDSQDAEGKTPLMYACETGRFGTVALLLKTKRVNTALMIAIARRAEDIVSLLIDSNKVDINTPDEDGDPPLYWAVWVRNVPITQLLLDTGEVNPASIDDVVNNPFMWTDNPAGQLVVDFANQRKRSGEASARRLQQELVMDDTSQATLNASDI
ncbi:hypothetical protein FKW77_001761 [Venturia effusa]|uniref:Heterokaryon incompatibility domain-containing protein n=1 Tax=Venturia effusa TaxID=50376 RepID=A0A517LEV8_9PEZI|nr:hypothetical protein FKW77_001761 [Venturia effusa]